jgi:hypothetical protein
MFLVALPRLPLPQQQFQTIAFAIRLQFLGWHALAKFLFKFQKELTDELVASTGARAMEFLPTISRHPANHPCRR